MNKIKSGGRFQKGFNFTPKPEEMAEFLSRFGITEKEFAESYKNCLHSGLEPNLKAPRRIWPLSRVTKLKKEQWHYLKAVLPLLEEVYKDLPGDFVSFLTDAQGINLFTIANSKKRKEYRRIKLLPGTDFSIQSAGTNAISMCLKLKRPVIIFGPQHYLKELFGDIWCAAGQVCLPNGELLWVFDVSAPTQNDLRLAVLVVNLVTKRLEQAVAEVWYQQDKIKVLREVAATLADEPLTKRELDIVLYLIENKTYAEIGQVLNLAIGTVNTYVPRIYRKLGVTGRIELLLKVDSKLKLAKKQNHITI